MPVERTTATEINWNSDLPIFANGRFLGAVGHRFGWIGGFDESGLCRCVLPYTLIRGPGVWMARFRVETIPLCDGFEVQEETRFLQQSMDFLKSIVADVVIPATTNAIFRTYPPRASAAPYGSYVLDLSRSEEDLWRNIDNVTRKNINSAKRNCVQIRDGMEDLEQAHGLIQETFKRSNLPFMSLGSLRRFVEGLGDNAKVLIAEYGGSIQSCTIFAYSNYCAYAVYGGNLSGQKEGSGKLLHWEAIRTFKDSGVKLFDFVGARIAPEKGSKQEGMNAFKRRFGGTLRTGYIWKYPLSPVKAFAYSLGVRVLRGGDIVDAESHKMAKHEVTQS